MREDKRIGGPPAAEIAAAKPETTREQIMLVGEQLFARNGIANTSMRAVAVAAGQGNVAAVQYHFGSKEGLIAAIFQYRVEQMEPVREAMLASIGNVRDASLREIFEIIFRPYLDLIDDEGNHVYARMLFDYLSRFGRFMLPHPARDAENGGLVIRRLLLELERRLDAAGIAEGHLPYRMLVTGLLGSLNDYDLRREQGLEVKSASDLLDEMLDFMAAVLVRRL